MAEIVIVPLPKDYTAELAAQTFAAYLLGQNVFVKGQFDTEKLNMAPPFFEQRTGKWQLDYNNNYSLYDNKDGTVKVIARYDADMLKKMVAMFRVANKMTTLEFIVPLPRGLTVENAAQEFAAHFAGAKVFRVKPETFKPIFLESGQKWQLDASNNYWLRGTGDRMLRLTCRYDYQFKLIEAMGNLFSVQYLPQ